MRHQKYFVLISVWCVFCHSMILMRHTRGRFMLGSAERRYPVQCSWCAASRQPCALGGKPGLILVQGKPGLSHSCFSIGINVFVTAWETDINIFLHMCSWRRRPWNNEGWGEVPFALRASSVILHDTFFFSFSHSFSSLHLQVRPFQAGKFCRCYINSSSKRLRGQEKGKREGEKKQDRKSNALWENEAQR